MDSLYTFRVINLHRVIDGDTMDLVIDVGFRTTLTQRIRLAIVDTPERGEAGYHEATVFARQWIADSQVLYVRTYSEDPWKRWVADVFRPGGDSLSSALLQNNLAVVW